MEDTCLESPGRSRWPSNAVENYKVRAIVECNPAIIRWSNYHKKGSNFTQCPLFFPYTVPSVRGPRLLLRGCRTELHVVDNGTQGSSADRLSRFLNKFSIATRIVPSISLSLSLSLFPHESRTVNEKNLIRTRGQGAGRPVKESLEPSSLKRSVFRQVWWFRFPPDSSLRLAPIFSIPLSFSVCGISMSARPPRSFVYALYRFLHLE